MLAYILGFASPSLGTCLLCLLVTSLRTRVNYYILIPAWLDLAVVNDKQQIVLIDVCVLPNAHVNN